MKTLFELAAFYADNAERQGNVSQSPQQALHTAAMKAVEGYQDLKEAEAEGGTRYDGFGNEIQPQVVWEACRYLRALPQWIDAQLEAAAIRIDERNAERIDKLPNADSWDRLACKYENDTMQKRHVLQSASAIFANVFTP